jgi:hypothetical protein
MVSADISKCQLTGVSRILTLTSLTTFLLLNINTTNCIASQSSNTVHGTINESKGKIIILILFNRRVRQIDLLTF